MLRTLDKRLDRLTPPAADTLVRHLYAAYTEGWRQLTLREYAAIGPSREGEPPHPRVVACNTAAGVPALLAQCNALVGDAELARRLTARNEADAMTDTPLHPISRLYDRLSREEVERIAELPDDAAVLAALLELAPAYGIDLDRPMGEQGL